MDIFDFEHELEEKPHHTPELWLVTFSDLLSLLVACFVMMMAFSTPDKSRFEQAASALNDGLASSTKATSTPAEKVDRIQQELDSMLKASSLEHVAQVRQDANGLTITLNESILFASGSAKVFENNVGIILKIGEKLGALPSYKHVTIEGHTDDAPIRSQTFRSNWELSSARALSVLELLSEAGIPASKLSIQGFGEFAPAVSNRDENNVPIEENRRKNRRVVIRIN